MDRKSSYFLCAASLILSEYCLASRIMLFCSICIVKRRFMFSACLCCVSSANLALEASSCNWSRSSRISDSNLVRCSFSDFHLPRSSLILDSYVEFSS
uniref:Putative secreted protein n=1 Tax=Anopheles darlingi TaxID=43151 RepID=A0A2M4D3F0_ANODA